MDPLDGQHYEVNIVREALEPTNQNGSEASAMEVLGDKIVDSNYQTLNKANTAEEHKYQGLGEKPEYSDYQALNKADMAEHKYQGLGEKPE